jgi:trigger factor
MTILEQEQLNPCTLKLTIEVEQEEVQKAMQAALRDLARQLRVPGFRPGKAPQHLVEQFVQKDVLLQRTAEILLPKAYRGAVEQLELETYGAPVIELNRLDEESTCEFTAKVPLPPKVELADYKGLTVERPDPNPTSEEVERELLEMRKRKAKRVKVERPAQRGDMAIVGLTPADQEAGKRFMVVVGQTFTQLDQELAGMPPGETKTASITFPENFEEAEWAGRPMDVRIELSELATVEVPELDDELARQSGFGDQEALKSAVRERIGAAKQVYSDDAVIDQLFNRLIGDSTIEIPDTMWESLAADRIDEIEADQARRNSTIEALATAQGLTVEQLKDAVREDARMQVKRLLVVRDIAKREGLELSQQEINDQIQRHADRTGVSFDAAKREIERRDGMDEIGFRAMFRKVAALLRDHASIVTVEAPSQAG